MDDRLKAGETIGLMAMQVMGGGMISQLTHRQQHHHLTNTHVWSWDGRWVYYDIRSDADGAVFDGPRIERVNTKTSEVEVVYEASHGACVGVATASPTEDRLVFIHGPEDPTSDWNYSASHRRGVVMCPGQASSVQNLDARDIVDPFTPGALRGGSHVHVFDDEGQWVSFTYEDHVLAMEPTGGQKNQRNVGVSIPHQPVSVPSTHPRNHEGAFWSVLATRTHDRPEPGSDQICKAYEDAWVAKKKGQVPSGKTSAKALAFLGDVVIETDSMQRGGAALGAQEHLRKTVPELFVVDLPVDCSVAGSEPLQGTATTRPAPPVGTVQRRLTRTTDRPYPGVATDVRHWPRSKPDGSEVCFLMRDDHGVIQLWSVPPDGGSLKQITRGKESVASAFTIHPGGNHAACVMGNSVCEVDLSDGRVVTLAEGGEQFRCLPFAVVYSPDGSRVAFGGAVSSGDKSCNQVFVVDSTAD
ncbi:Uncharacterized protein YidR [Rhodopirellula islandica]|uniref:Uncharacterized protein YidR n=1 Tax=Rhodopirellula islandica TaxID=595434 RepID=A0A0J1BAA8_RHOIS|nr:DUF3748 domain-containing protein [Rhodopirellula islandica]KLU03406.1 Uncharacterized protein YidR [Rhodopirellula islandica]